MIELEVENGRLTTEVGVFFPSFSHKELDALVNNCEISYRMEHGEYRTFRFQPKESGARGVMVALVRGEIEFVEVLPRRQDGLTESEALENLLASLGGAQKYAWGHVRMVHDSKAGYSSVYIIYNNSNNVN